jgi:molybdopterin synthase sulfur carrier subunit
LRHCAILPAAMPKTLRATLECSQRHGFALSADRLRVALNGEFASWDRPLANGDEIAFLPPVSGG